MPSHLRIGTWNLDRSGVRKTSRVQPQLDVIKKLNADIWILTETHSSAALNGFESVTSDFDSNYLKEGESYVTILSRFPMQRIAPFTTACAEISLPFSPFKMIVYGTIITYGADGVYEGEAKAWERHRQAVQAQTAEWSELQGKYPDHLRCVAGDFNENLDGTRWYGVNDAKIAILRGLSEAGLTCETTADLRRNPYKLSRATVDHICLSRNHPCAIHMDAWEGTIDGNTLSDHNGVLIDITFL